MTVKINCARCRDEREIDMYFSHAGVSFTERFPCPDCNECGDCDGEGFVDFARWSPVRDYFTTREPCPTCSPQD